MRAVQPASHHTRSFFLSGNHTEAAACDQQESANAESERHGAHALINIHRAGFQQLKRRHDKSKCNNNGGDERENPQRKEQTGAAAFRGMQQLQRTPCSCHQRRQQTIEQHEESKRDGDSAQANQQPGFLCLVSRAWVSRDWVPLLLSSRRLRSTSSCNSSSSCASCV